MGERGGEGEFVGVFYVAAGRESATETGDLEVGSFELSAQVERGQIALGRGVCREYHFADGFLSDAAEKFGNMKGMLGLFLRRDIECAAKNMVETAVATRPLDGDDVHRLFDDTEESRVPILVGTDATEIVLGDVETS